MEPPHMRGKDFHRSGFQTSDRITPAWAGKRISNRRCRQALPDHPRVGGEKALMPENRLVMQGSPPRGRGKAQAFRVRPVGRGITPAWAGKRRPQQRHRMALQDHPRVGGEKIWAARLAVASRGSPPHGRGKVLQVAPLCAEPGITPAWAGKSRKLWVFVPKKRNHPRVGGEK